MNEITLEQALILLDESQQHNAAIVNRLYEIFNIDSSDGEVRAKWALLEASKVVKERAALAAQVETLKSAAEKMMFKGRIVSNVCYNIGQRHKDAEQILQAVIEYDSEVRKFHDAVSISPQQHLAEIRAQAVMDTADFFERARRVSLVSINAIRECADGLRRGEVE